MLDSVRVRLTLWYSTVLAAVLLVLALASYFLFARSTAHRMDADLAQLADAFLVTFQDELTDQTNTQGVAGAARQSILEHRFRDHLFAVVDRSGALVAATPESPAAGQNKDASQALSSNVLASFANAAKDGEGGTFQTIQVAGGHYRGFVRGFHANGQPFALLVLRSLRSQQEMLAGIRGTFAWVIPLAILLAASGGYFLARKSLEPVAAMSEQAGHIGSSNLHERLHIRNERDELGRLAKSFNDLLDRLDQSFERQRRFIADASHELRTPVAILRGEAEVALSAPARRAEEYRESLAILQQEARRLANIVEDLFTLTRADSGQYAISPGNFFLEEMVNDSVHSIRALAIAKGIALTADATGELPIRGDETLLRRMLLNLLDNAIKYTPQGGKVAVACRRQESEYALSVFDTGAGIPAELQPRIFERFFRADKARARANPEGGAGLGLAIARWVAEAHDGRLELTRSDESGSTFTVFLPAAPVPALQPH